MPEKHKCSVFDTHVTAVENLAENLRAQGDTAMADDAAALAVRLKKDRANFCID